MKRLITALSLVFSTYGFSDLIQTDEAHTKLCQSYDKDSDFLFEMKHKADKDQDSFIMCVVNNNSDLLSTRKIFSIHSKSGQPNELATYVGEEEGSFDKRTHILRKSNSEESDLLILEIKINEDDGKLEAKLHFHDQDQVLKTAKYSTSLFMDLDIGE